MNVLINSLAVPDGVTILFVIASELRESLQLVYFFPFVSESNLI